MATELEVFGAYNEVLRGLEDLLYPVGCPPGPFWAVGGARIPPSSPAKGDFGWAICACKHLKRDGEPGGGEVALLRVAWVDCSNAGIVYTHS